VTLGSSFANFSDLEIFTVSHSPAETSVFAKYFESISGFGFHGTGLPSSSTLYERAFFHLFSSHSAFFASTTYEFRLLSI